MVRFISRYAPDSDLVKRRTQIVLSGDPSSIIVEYERGGSGFYYIVDNDVREFIKKNIKGEVGICGVQYHDTGFGTITYAHKMVFEKEEDAMIFKLTYG